MDLNWKMLVMFCCAIATAAAVITHDYISKSDKSSSYVYQFKTRVNDLINPPLITTPDGNKEEIAKYKDPVPLERIKYMKMNGKYYYTDDNEKLIAVDTLEQIPIKHREEITPAETKAKLEYIRKLKETENRLKSNAFNLKNKNRNLKRLRKAQMKKVERQVRETKRKKMAKERARKLEEKREADRWKFNYETESSYLKYRNR